MLLNLVEAPPPVLAFFCRFHGLHEVPIADNLNVDVVDEFIANHPIRKFYTSDQVVGIIIYTLYLNKDKNF